MQNSAPRKTRRVDFLLRAFADVSTEFSVGTCTTLYTVWCNLSTISISHCVHVASGVVNSRPVYGTARFDVRTGTVPLGLTYTRVRYRGLVVTVVVY